MELVIQAEGDVVERTELLNGTSTIAIEGGTADGAWTVAGVLSWNRGLVDFSGEGDLTVSGEGGEVFATLTVATLEEGGEYEEDVRLTAKYEVDGGSGRFEGTLGRVEGRVRVVGERFEGEWRVGSENAT